MILAVVTNEVAWDRIFEMHLNGYILCLFFGAIGIFLSQVVRGIKNYMGPVVGIVMGTYFIHAIGKAIDDANWIAKVSPFYHLGVDDIYPLSIIVILVISVCALYFGNQIFNKKDIGA